MSTTLLHGKDNYSLSFGPNDIRVKPSVGFAMIQNVIVALASAAFSFIVTSVSRVFARKTITKTCTILGKATYISNGRITPIIDTSCGSFAFTLPNGSDDIMTGQTYRIEHTEGIKTSYGYIRSITLV